MRTAPHVLRLFAARAREGRLVTFQDVARELDITEQAAVDTLTRLWRQRVITAFGPRPRRHKWSPDPGERVGTLRFRLAPRGDERLRWWAEKARKKTGDRWPL